MGLTGAPAAITLPLLHTHTDNLTVRQLLGNITLRAADARTVEQAHIAVILIMRYCV